MQVKFKQLHPGAELPTKANALDAGYDLHAVGAERNEDQVTYHTGLSVAIPAGYVGLIFPRSSICRYDLALSNSVGVIDSGYRGEIKVVFRTTKTEPGVLYRIGNRIAQLIIMPIPNWEPEWADELPEAGDGRGTGGFGSSGN